MFTRGRRRRGGRAGELLAAWPRLATATLRVLDAVALDPAWLDDTGSVPDVLAALARRPGTRHRTRPYEHPTLIVHFVRAILLAEPLLAPVSESMNAVRLTNAILLSGWLCQEVPFDFDEDLFLDELNARIRAEGGFPERS